MRAVSLALVLIAGCAAPRPVIPPPPPTSTTSTTPTTSTESTTTVPTTSTTTTTLYRPCVDGPDWLRSVDAAEAQHGGPATVTMKDGRSISAEQFAEALIDDCYRQVTPLEALASTNPKGIGLVARLFRANLDYMQWWLRNRRERRH